MKVSKERTGKGCSTVRIRAYLRALVRLSAPSLRGSSRAPAAARRPTTTNTTTTTMHTTEKRANCCPTCCSTPQALTPGPACTLCFMERALRSTPRQSKKSSASRRSSTTQTVTTRTRFTAPLSRPPPASARPWWPSETAPGGATSPRSISNLAKSPQASGARPSSTPNTPKTLTAPRSTTTPWGPAAGSCPRSSSSRVKTRVPASSTRKTCRYLCGEGNPDLEILKDACSETPKGSILK